MQGDGYSKKESKRNARDLNTVTEMKNVFDGLVSRMDMAKERISELEDMWLETKKLREKRLKINKTEYPRSVRQLQKI